MNTEFCMDQAEARCANFPLCFSLSNRTTRSIHTQLCCCKEEQRSYRVDRRRNLCNSFRTAVVNSVTCRCTSRPSLLEFVGGMYRGCKDLAQH